MPLAAAQIAYPARWAEVTTDIAYTATIRICPLAAMKKTPWR
jgi:hypothetical protein